MEDFKKLTEIEFIKNGKRRPGQLFTVKAASTSDCSLETICRIRDVLFSLVALILLSPTVLVISLAIYISLRKPVFFRQKRPGRYGKLFTMYKFRTMRNDAEEVLKNDPNLYHKYIENDCKFKPGEDPRMTQIGHFLRVWSLDEIPQLLNVIRGDMSLVGPRPILPEQIGQYGEDAEEFFTVKPGITGLWQVSGRNEIPYPGRKYLDLAYVRNRSISLDLKIMLRTVKAVYTKRGAY